MYPINAVRTIGKAIVYVSFNISIGSSSFLLYNSIIIFQNNFLFHFTSHNQSLTWKQVKTEGKYFDFSNINYKEIHIIAYYNNYRVSCSFTQDDNGNYYFGSNEPGWVGAVIIKDNTNKGISLQNFLLSGSDVTIDANIAVYYR
nr:MAG TPA: hypothetical protein [Caudoviricetes sp.]